MKGKTAFLFPGQGAQHVGMGQKLYAHSPVVRQVFEEAADVLGRRLDTLCFEGPAEALDLAHNTQPCILALEVAVIRLLQQQGIEADYLCGFSLGEYAALVAGGVLNLKHALLLVQSRADLMQAAVVGGGGGMLVLLVPDEAVAQALCDETGGDVWPANINAPGQVVVSGSEQAIANMSRLVKKKGVDCVPVAMSTPSHCPLMKPAADELARQLGDMDFADSVIPIVANVDGEAIQGGYELKSRLLKQLVKPVRFDKCVRTLWEKGVTRFVEAGPGKTLGGLVKRNLDGQDGLELHRLDSVEALDALQKALG